MHIVITGAAGHIGRILMSGLPQHWTLTGIDRQPASDPRVHCIDLGKVGDLTLESVDVAIHLAANPDESQPLSEHVESNIIGCEAFLRWCGETGVRRVLYASSCETFMGHSDRGQEITTHSAFSPRNIYGCTKVFGEMLCRMITHQYGVDTLAMRLGALLPPAMDADLVNDEQYQAIKLPEDELISAIISFIEGRWEGAHTVFLGPKHSSALPTTASIQTLFASKR